MSTPTQQPARTATPAAPAVSRRPGLRTVLSELALCLVVVVGVLAWMGPSLYRQDLVFLTATYALVALGMYIPFVLAGSLSMAYSAYAAIGAYAVAILAVKQGVSPWWGWLAGMAISAVVAVIIALATRKLSGFYLAAVTLLFALAFEHWLGDATPLTGGASGISAIPVPTFFGFQLPRYALVVAAILFVCVIAVLLDRLRRSAWGLSLSAARESTPAVQSSGISPTHLTVVALATGAAIASTGGALFTASVQAVTPETFALDLVFLAIFMPIIGGRGSAWGAPLGALIVVAVTLNMPGYQGSGELLLAVVVLVILLLAPGGVIGWTRQAVERLRGKKG